MTLGFLGREPPILVNLSLFQTPVFVLFGLQSVEHLDLHCSVSLSHETLGRVHSEVSYEGEKAKTH